MCSRLVTRQHGIIYVQFSVALLCISDVGFSVITGVKNIPLKLEFQVKKVRGASSKLVRLVLTQTITVALWSLSLRQQRRASRFPFLLQIPTSELNGTHHEPHVSPAALFLSTDVT